MRITFTIFLFIANVIAFAWVYFLEKDHSLLDSVPGDYEMALLIKEADYVEISSPSLEQNRRLVRDRQDWFLEEPYNWAANPHAVTRLLNQIEFLDVKARFAVSDIIASGQGLADYGLEEPSFVVRFGTATDETVLQFGSQTEVGQRMYVLSPDKKEVLVVDQSLLASILVDLEELRRSTIFNIPVFMVNRMLLEYRANQTSKFRIVKANDDWTFETPFAYDASDQEVMELAGKLCAMPIVSFLPEEEAEPALLGLSTPQFSITLASDRARQTLLVGNLVEDYTADRPQYYAKLESNDSLFIIEPTFIDTIKTAESSLRDRSIIEIELDSVTEIEIAKDGETISLQQLEKQSEEDQTRWRALKETTENTLKSVVLDQRILKKLLNQISQLRAVSFLSDAPSEVEIADFGLNPPRKTISIKGRELIVLELGAPDSNNVTVPLRVKGDPYVFEVGADISLETPIDLNMYRDRVLSEIPADHVLQSVRIIDVENPEQVLWEVDVSNQEEYEASLESMEIAEIDRIKRILAYAKKFSVQAYYDESPEDGFLFGDQIKPWRFAFVINSLSQSNPEDVLERRFLLTERIGGSLQVGAWMQENEMFTLTQELINDIFPYTFDRPILKKE